VQAENSMQCRLPYHKVKENFWSKEDWIWRGGRHIRDKLATVCSPPMWGHWAGTGFTHGLCFV
jgi:hypothetical protein